MDMNTEAGVQVLTLTPAGELTDAMLPAGDTLRGLQEAIGCACVDVIQLSSRLDIWLDDEGLWKPEPQLNRGAMAVLASFGYVGAAIVGTAVFAEHDAEGDTTSLSESARTAIRELLGC
ncbi:hypothetical protein PSD17_10100 [Pseudonocardia sp. D17]|nr:hypothetical protein PSD17_10100 [Pseudonocardia sp. D17]